MAEQLLDIRGMCLRLGKMSRNQFGKIEPLLIAKGLQKLYIGSTPLYRESSLDNLLCDLFTQENPSIEIPHRTRKEQS